MTYLDWVDAVLEAAVQVAAADDYSGSVGVGIAAIANAVGVGMDKDVQGALHTASDDLAAMGMRTNPGSSGFGRVLLGWFERAAFGPSGPASFESSARCQKSPRPRHRGSEVREERWADLRIIELKDVLRDMGREASHPAACAISDRLRQDNTVAPPVLTSGA